MGSGKFFLFYVFMHCSPISQIHLSQNQYNSVNLRPQWQKNDLWLGRKIFWQTSAMSLITLMHIYRESPGSLTTPSVAIQPEFPRRMQIGDRKFSIKGENWIALMLIISDHNLKKLLMYLNSNRMWYVYWSQTWRLAPLGRWPVP